MKEISKRYKINRILEINNKIIKIKSNNPNDYFSLKKNRFALQKSINELLKSYNSGPSSPSI
jgi:hypothetical protein